MRFFLNLSVCCALLCSAIAVQAQQIIVVTDSHHPITNVPANTRVIELDAAQRLHDELSKNLPNNSQQAKQVARQRLQQSGIPQQQAMQSALQGLVDAWAIGITKIPAVVLDGHVIYGESDINKAVTEIKSYQEQRP